MKLVIICIFFIALNNVCFSKKINIAISSNFLFTSKIISIKFENKYNVKTLSSSDSTANLFTKIKNNAPFDIFLSADSKHTKLLEKINCFKNKSFNYAYGYLVLFSKNKKIKKQILKYSYLYKNIILSNFKLSPYGYSSKKILKNLKLKNIKKIIYGSNINHTFSMVYHNTCEIGITSLSNIMTNKIKTCFYWKIPKYIYPIIKQNILIIENNDNLIFNDKFLKYLKSKKIIKIIKKNGYKI